MLELEFAMDRAGREKDMDSRVRRVLDRFPGRINVFVIAASQIHKLSNLEQFEQSA